MRAVADYELAEWARGVPFVHGFKRARNVAIDRTFRRIPARGYDRFMADLAGLQPQTVGVVIAFNTPWVIDVTTRVTKKNLAGTLIVCDNSRDPAARRQIERICRDRGVPYLGLPFNPEWHPCRSHGIAINWAYYNIIEQLQPKVFGILDHDLFPLNRVDLAALVADQPVYGALNPKPWGWGLWAGYCVFDRAAIAKFAPDFNNDLPRQLDTGGRNWMQIYRHLDRARLRFARQTNATLRCAGHDGPVRMEMYDDCLHVGGAGYAGTRGIVDKRAFVECVIRHIESGGTLGELTTAPVNDRVA